MQFLCTDTLTSDKISVIITIRTVGILIEKLLGIMKLAEDNIVEKNGNNKHYIIL